MKSLPIPEGDLISALHPFDSLFNPILQLVQGVVGQARYHTQMSAGSLVHQTRESTEYASALLATSDRARHARAESILHRVLPLQDTDPESPFCGTWPWFYEESLKEMSPPDLNWADFIGASLAEVLSRSKGQLSGDTVRAVSRALHLAALCIQRRDVSLSYTNIAIMGCYVTIMAGNIVGNSGLLKYGKERLRRFLQFTKNYGGFPEYNSPTYAIVAVLELTRMLRDFSDEDDRSIAIEIHDWVWSVIAIHWHGPSRQWAGPHSRSYSTMLTPESLSYLQAGLAGKGTLTTHALDMPLASALLPIRCPDRYVSYFLDDSPRRHHRMNISNSRPALEACMHMEPAFVISSAERATFWNQSRGLIAYAVSDSKPVAMTIRFLHDGYDFCSANLLCRQKENMILAGLCFASDGGDKHGDLDRYSQGRINASDWRLRFEFFNLDETVLPCDLAFGTIETFAFGSGSFVGMKVLFCEFGVFAPSFETGSDEKTSWIDLVFYKGDNVLFDFHESFPASCGLALMIATERRALSVLGQARAADEEREWALSLPETESSAMKLKIPRFPLSTENLLGFAISEKISGLGG